MTIDSVGVPAGRDAGLILVIVGLTADILTADVAAAGSAGCGTEMLAPPGAAIRLAGTEAVRWLESTNVVVSGVLSHRTTAPETKSPPWTLSVKPGPPATAALGEIPKSCGTTPGAIVKL